MKLTRWWAWFSLAAAALWCSARAAESLAQVDTPLGGLLVVLYDTDKPETVANFKHYITSARFRDTYVQRWEPGFVIQGGGFFMTNRYEPSPAIAAVPTFGMIKNEYSVGRLLSNAYGTIAMARIGGQTNSATSQWFFNLTNNAFLDAVDGGFTVFGRVAAGTNVLNRFHADTPTDGLYRVNLGGALRTLPVLSLKVAVTDFVYTAFSLPSWPRVQIAAAGDGTRRIAWNSLSNFVNHVEFSPGWPLIWQPLVSTNGTGQPMEVLDPRSGGAGGYYRVRIE